MNLEKENFVDNPFNSVYYFNGDFMEIIATIFNDYTSKFGVPRQSNLVGGENSTIVFEPKYRVDEALRGIDEFSHIWILWLFDNENDEWSPTVRPPRLGGNKRMGVFATRSPNRPNPIGISSVKLEGVIKTQEQGKVLMVSGADLMNGTKIIDIKPYLPYVDSHPEATNGFALSDISNEFQVIFPDNLMNIFTPEQIETLTKVLKQDPRPQYIKDDDREYGLIFGNHNIKFTVKDNLIIVFNIQ